MEINKLQSFLAIVVSLIPPVLSIGIPFFWIILNIDQLQRGFTTELLILSLRTISLGLIASSITILFSLFFLYLIDRITIYFWFIKYPSGIGYDTWDSISLIFNNISNSKFSFTNFTIDLGLSN